MNGTLLCIIRHFTPSLLGNIFDMSTLTSRMNSRLTFGAITVRADEGEI